MTEQSYTFAIVGLGPRGSYALECLVEALQADDGATPVHLLLFDDSRFLGAGPVYALDQADSNWINVSERALELDGRDELRLGAAQIPRFPSYHEWAGIDVEEWSHERVDAFPPRLRLGNYLNERLRSLVEPLANSGQATLVEKRVGTVAFQESRWLLDDDSGDQWEADDVLLTIGHQPTRLDGQLLEWSRRSRDDSALTLHVEPYPVTTICDAAADRSGNLTIAIRGFGLAMMDVVRALALRFGVFEETDEESTSYLATSSHQLKLVPFSLDGLPMSPKPSNALLDEYFTPTSDEFATLQRLLGDRPTLAGATDADFLIQAVAPVATNVFRRLQTPRPTAPSTVEELLPLIVRWLESGNVTHPAFVQTDEPTLNAIDEFVRMATGNEVISIDYCVGQVWRHCQPSIYEELSHNILCDEAMVAVVALDERMKRYSFGPPVASLRQLQALIAAEVLTLDFVNDPDICLGEQGWTFTNGAKSVTASTMINSVLDAPQLLQVRSPLITGLLSDDIIQPAHDKLGILTEADGAVISVSGTNPGSLSVLGRLAKGTVIGVDAILECFGERPRVWGAGAVRRMMVKND